MTISLEDILVEKDLWVRNEGSPAPDKPTIMSILGSPSEDSPLVRDGVPKRRTEHFARQIRTYNLVRETKAIGDPNDRGDDSLG